MHFSGQEPKYARQEQAYCPLLALFIFASDVVAGVYGESGTGGRYRA